MSNHDRKPNTPANGGQNNEPKAPEGGQQQEKKTSIIGKLIKIKDDLMQHKPVRMIVNGLKVAGVGGVAFFSYKAGARSVKPTTVYIREGVTEEETPVETQETVDEETGEVTE